jgi:RNA polymerase sigma-70 factor (ECF subfamily)
VGGPDAALVARLKARDANAFEVAVRQYGGRMLTVARRLLADENDAQDAVQSAFVAMFRSIDRFEGNSQLGTWLHRIAVNSALMALRSRRRRHECPIEPLLPSFEADGHRRDTRPAWSLPAPEDTERAELRETVRRKVAELPEQFRIVLVLRDIEGLDTDETAQVLDIKPGAVKTRLHRARMALRTLLESEFLS